MNHKSLLSLAVLSAATSFGAQLNFHDGSDSSVVSALGAASTHSQTISGNDNTRLFTLIKPSSGSFTATVTAWSDTKDLSTTDTFEQANLARYSHGLGVCNDDEACSNPGHMVDNSGSTEDRDFVWFRFSEAINVNSITVYSFGYDRDLSLWTRNSPTTPGSLAGKTPTTSNTAGADLFNLGYTYKGDINSNTGADPLAINLGLGNALVTELIISAKLGDNNDYFKIAALNFKYSNDPTLPGSETGVPEPSTYLTLGAALVGIGAYKRSRR